MNKITIKYWNHHEQTGGIRLNHCVQACNKITIEANTIEDALKILSKTESIIYVHSYEVIPSKPIEKFRYFKRV